MKHYNGNPHDLMNEMVGLGRKLAEKSNDYADLCKDFAEKERSYNVALVSKMMELKLPPYNIASTACEKHAKGDPSIARLRYDRDVARGIMRACEKAMSNLQTVLNAHQSILAWERKVAEL